MPLSRKQITMGSLQITLRGLSFCAACQKLCVFQCRTRAINCESKGCRLSLSVLEIYITSGFDKTKHQSRWALSEKHYAK